MRKFLLATVCVAGSTLFAIPTVEAGDHKLSKPWIKDVPQTVASNAGKADTTLTPVQTVPPTSSRIIGGVDAEGSFPNVGRVHAYINGRPTYKGTGTLVHGRWMLTAAHVVEVCLNNGGAIGFEVGGRIYWADRYAVHPNYNRRTPPVSFEPAGLPYGDISLVRLSTAVPASIKPAYFQTVAGTVGQRLTLVGCGLTGSGQTGGNQSSGGRKRAGVQVVEAVGSDWLLWSFDRGEQYSTAPGDSGGPQFNSSGGIVSITTGGNNRGVGRQGWGNICWNTRCDVHLPWMQSVVSQNSASAVPTGVRYLVQPDRAAGDLLNLLPTLPIINFDPMSLMPAQSLE